MISTKLTLASLRKVANQGWRARSSLRAPRLTRLAEFLNKRFSEYVSARVESSETNTDRNMGRLRWPGKGRKGNKLSVVAQRELRLSGFLYGKGPDVFKSGQIIFEHDSSETYRYNAEAVRQVVLLVEQLKKMPSVPSGLKRSDASGVSPSKSSAGRGGREARRGQGSINENNRPRRFISLSNLTNRPPANDALPKAEGKAGLEYRNHHNIILPLVRDLLGGVDSNQKRTDGKNGFVHFPA